MAGILETLTIPRASGLPSATAASLGSSSVCAVSFRRSVRLPESRGLKILSSSMTASRGSVSSRVGARRRARIVCEFQKTAVEVAAVTEATWKSLVLESDSAVLVEFWAEWCGPCRMIHPVIDELAKEYVGKLKCYKLNTDENGKVASEYGIRSIPTVIIFKNGQKKEAIIGAVPKTTLASSIEKFL
ncbi:uncharacterized protein LOC127812112 isoform X1 [Diospyros lotus]|uniref:uncharacterized protein LOC127812112 isoform X1 n=1 Tax=Diospyros lotus TaxID=55363 RepID=UPI00225529E5|nr:uncharacterized protein LOC127812112 isoform X1 [Diospyros lotus]